MIESITRRAVVMIALTIATVLAACGGSPARPDADLRITAGTPGHRESFHLMCSPDGGDVPDPTTLCAIIQANQRTMLFPPQPKSICIGGVGFPPGVDVTGTYYGRSVTVHARTCDRPVAIVHGVIRWLSALAIPYK